MRRLSSIRSARPVALAGLSCGAVVGIAAALLAGSATAQQADASPQAVLEATHNPPLLTLPGEPLELSYDVYCATAGVEDPEESCGVSGSLFVRPAGRGTFRELPLGETSSNGLRKLAAGVPDDLAASRDGIEYYASIGSADTTIAVPAGGATAPDRTRQLAGPVEVPLGAHVFGQLRGRSARVAAARWDDGPTDVGLEQDRDLAAIGATAFDVDRADTVYVLDEAHRRMLRWSKGGSAPSRVPLSIDGRLADMAVAGDGSIYVLESMAPAGRHPLLRRFDENGRDLDVVETAERPSQIRVGADGPFVLEQPSNQWMPAVLDGQPASSAQQRAHGRSARPLRSGGEVVVRRLGDEIRVALLRDGALRRAWRITSTTPLAEVQLAEPMGQRLVLVVRAYSDTTDEFLVLLLDRKGLAESFSVDPADWAESAPLGRFRLVNGSLFQLGSTASGAFVDRFDLEVH